MRLQLALDTFSLEEALNLVKKAREHVDIIEIGTPFLLEYGMDAVRCFRKDFPEKEILADAKIMDAGEIEAAAAFRAGANYVTVLAVTDDLTMRACVETANRYGGQIVADMICVTDIPTKIRALEASGVHGIAVHTGVDQQRAGRTPLDDLAAIKTAVRQTQVFVAGGIRLETIPDYAALAPDVLIIGGAIGSSQDPAGAAKAIRKAISRFEE